MNEESDEVILSAPNSSELKKDRKATSSLIWSSGSEGSSLLFAGMAEGIDRSSVASPTPDLPEMQLMEIQSGVQDYVSTALETLEKRLENVLDSISDELTSEVIRERQHLLLMQEKVDMQGQTLQREFTELNKKMTQESTIRAMVQQKYREQNDALGENLKSISKEISELKSAINQMETPWVYKAFNSVLSAFQQCSIGHCQYNEIEGEDSQK